jgi:glycosyltransferase involved in cell wall biosynthesis
MPRMGIVAGWFDPEQPSVWSGVPHSILRELRRFVKVDEVASAVPFVKPAKAIHRLRLHPRLGAPDSRSLWTLTPEMRMLSRATSVYRRLPSPGPVDAWLHLCGAYGRFTRGKYLALGELPPTRMGDMARWASSFGFPGASRRQLEWVGRRNAEVYKGAYRCCVASRWIADGLIRAGVDHSKVHIIGYGSNLGMTPPSARDWSTPRYLIVGWDWERKNGDAVLRAFQQLRRRVPEATLDIVGHHPAIDLPGVTGHGPLSVFEPESRELVMQLYARSTCFVMPSWIEPFGIVYVEAASAGIPSIGTKIGGTSESIGDGGICIDPSDEQALLKAMIDLSDPAVAAEMGELARRRSEGLTWRLTAERILRAADLPWPEPVQLADFLC